MLVGAGPEGGGGIVQRQELSEFAGSPHQTEAPDSCFSQLGKFYLEKKVGEEESDSALLGQGLRRETSTFLQHLSPLSVSPGSTSLGFWSMERLCPLPKEIGR